MELLSKKINNNIVKYSLVSVMSGFFTWIYSFVCADIILSVNKFLASILFVIFGVFLILFYYIIYQYSKSIKIFKNSEKLIIIIIFFINLFLLLIFGIIRISIYHI